MDVLAHIRDSDTESSVPGYSQYETAWPILAIKYYQEDDEAIHYGVDAVNFSYNEVNF